MFINAFRRFCRSHRGSVAVEFALASPVMVAVLVAAWDVGRLINTTTDLTNMSRTGMHYASSKYWDADTVEAAVLAEAERQGISGFSVSVSSTCECSDGSIPADCGATTACTGGDIKIYTTVSTTQAYEATIPFPGITTSTSFTRAGQVRVR